MVNGWDQGLVYVRGQNQSRTGKGLWERKSNNRLDGIEALFAEPYGTTGVLLNYHRKDGKVQFDLSHVTVRESMGYRTSRHDQPEILHKTFLKSFTVDQHFVQCPHCKDRQYLYRSGLEWACKKCKFSYTDDSLTLLRNNGYYMNLGELIGLDDTISIKFKK